MEINILSIIGVVGIISVITFGCTGYKKGFQKNSTESEKNTGTLMSDIGYIKAGIDDLKHKQESAELRHFALAE